MTLFNSFVGAFGLLLLFAVGLTSWAFRTSTAPIAAKLMAPACLVLLAVFTPFRVLTLLGYPMPTSLRDMPQRAELLAFVPYNDDKRVDLWLREGTEPPRSYDIELTPGMKETLRQARSQKEQGARVMLERRGKASVKHQGYIDIDGGDAPYILDADAFRLPNKGEK